ncbi:MAG TPA: ABC transporter ATP-binding protein [Streptosporangiaceae bacterium]|nr:ABC transporter ATP-binding protein [Streptosporangiaceae bacterium]
MTAGNRNRQPATTRQQSARPGEAARTLGSGYGEGWLRRLTAYCWRHKRLSLVAFGASLVSTVMTAVIPLIQRYIVDGPILARSGPIWPGAVALIGAALISFGAVYLRRYRGGQLSLDVQHDLRTELFGSLTRLDGARQDQLHTGQIVSRSISDLNMIQSLLQMMPMLLGNGLLFFVSLSLMLWLSPLLAVISLAVGPALLVLSLVSRRRLFPASWDAQQKAGEVAGVVEGAVTGVRVVKGFGQENQEIDRVESVSSVLFAARVRAVRLMARFSPALGAVPALGQVGVLALGGYMAIKGEIPLGTFLAFAAYLAQLVNPVRALTNLITVGQEARASVIRVFEVIDSRPVLTEKPDAVVLPPGSKDVELDDVHFGYVPSEPVLRGLSLRVRPGETLAVVGTSGSGKSTISLLLPRFYDVRSGAIRVGGYDVRDLSLDSLRASIGLVLEESFLFSDSVRNNIAYGRPDARQEQIVAAARAAEAEEFILGLPDAYDTVVGEQGLTLSGGQRQRVALARALITDPSILILDDATSAIDARVEAQIHATLRKVMAGRTTLLIAHRRSTLELADQIAVLDAGRLIDQGTHEELTRRCPQYRLLLAGPGDDAEGTDAGELSYYRNEAEQDAAACRAAPARGQVTPSLWPATQAAGQAGTSEAGSKQLANAAATGIGRGQFSGGVGGGRGGGAAQRGAALSGGAAGGGWMAGVPASPELLAKVAALPPADDQPGVDDAFARAPDPHFTLRKLLKPFAVALLIGLILDALDAIAGTVMPLLVRGGIDNGIERHLLSFDARFKIIALVSVVGLGIVLTDWAINWAQTIVVGRNGERLLYTLRVKIFSHLQRLGLDFYEREMTGRIMTRMTTDVDALSSFFQTGLITMVNSVLTFVVVLILMLVINVRLGLTLALFLPFLIAATVIFRAKSSKAYSEARERVSMVNADLQENVAGLRVAQAYRREQVNSERFAGLSGAYRKSRLRAQRMIALYFPFVQALSTLGGAVILLVAAGPAHSGVLSAGSLIAYLLWVDQLFAPIQQMSQVFDGYQQANVGLKRISALLQTPTTTPQAEHPIRPERLRGQIELRDVHFGYAGQRTEAIRGVNLSIRPGETVALVGQTGAGKSTLVKLIARFYDVTAGGVLIDGTDVREYDLPAYRQQLGVVPQESYLFAGTVRDAIAYGRPEATDAEVEAAARGVGAIDMISRLPGGFMHEVSERGRNLAAGQRQLIALARAYLVDPAILLLDEATAALDLAAEAEVNRATEQLAARRTTIVVAHRLTTASVADRIVVMAGGQIAETGTHDELLARGGAYAAMWAAFTGAAELVG